MFLNLFLIPKFQILLGLWLAKFILTPRVKRGKLQISEITSVFYHFYYLVNNQHDYGIKKFLGIFSLSYTGLRFENLRANPDHTFTKIYLWLFSKWNWNKYEIMHILIVDHKNKATIKKKWTKIKSTKRITTKIVESHVDRLYILSITWIWVYAKAVS